MNNDLKIIKGEEIKDKEIEEAIYIDSLVYPEEYRGTMDICKSWQDKNKEIYIFLKNIKIDKVIGCINLMPLNDEYFNIINSGKVIDLEIPSSAIRNYDESGLYKMCLISITLLDEYRDSEAIKLLYGALLDKLIELSNRGIYCDELLADVISKDGDKFCTFLGCKFIRNSDHNSSIYKVKFSPFEFNIVDNKGKLLKEKYEFFNQ